MDFKNLNSFLLDINAIRSNLKLEEGETEDYNTYEIYAIPGGEVCVKLIIQHGSYGE